MMDIDSAIIHAEEVAEEKEQEAQGWINDGWQTAFINLTLERENELKKERIKYKESCETCAEEHRQLAEWLKELKQTRQAIEDIKEK